MQQPQADQRVPRAERHEVNQSVDVRTSPYGDDDHSQGVVMPATVLDLSSSGASLCMALNDDIKFHGFFEIGIDGIWGKARVVWRGRGEVLMCGVEFIEPDPAFLAALGQFLEPDRSANSQYAPAHDRWAEATARV